MAVVPEPGKPETEQRHHRAGGAAVVGGLGAGDAFDRALTEFLRVFRHRPLDAVREKARKCPARAGEDADAEADQRAAYPRRKRTTPLLGRHHQPANDRRWRRRCAAVMRGNPEDFADGEKANGGKHDVDPAKKLGATEGQPGDAGLEVDADHRQQQANDTGHSRACRRIARERAHRRQREHHQREVLGRPEAQRDVDEHRRQQHEQHGADRACHKRSDRRRGQRGARAPVARHLHSVDGRHRRCRVARRVHENRRRRSAIHRAVVDAPEHDERRRRLEAEGRRQQQRDGNGRTDAGQHSDSCTQHHADETKEQVHRRQRDGEALGEVSDQIGHFGSRLSALGYQLSAAFR